MTAVPAFVTHYHLADKPPFLNLSDLPDEEAMTVIRELDQRRVNGRSKRVFGRRYMQLRRLTEAKLYALFLERGGKPERKVPHYFVLGASRWYRGLSPDTRDVVVRLCDLPRDVTSFTYPDSFTSMAFGPQFGLPHEPRPYHEKVYGIAELKAVVDLYGLPSDETDAVYDGYQHRPFEKYIEVQLWSDAPIRCLLNAAPVGS